MDSALKERLLGAAVVIALAVIFVPMFVSNSPQKQDTTVNLDIPPAPDRKFETRTLPVETPAPATPASAPVPEANTPDANKIVTVDTKAAPRADAHPEDNAPAASTPKAESKPEPKPVAPVETKLATPTPAPAPALPASGRFAVSLGIYADQAHADALVARVKGMGQPAYSESTEYQGKPALRVRVGPFADRASAEAARLKIKQAEPKVPSSVIESGESAAAAAEPAPTLAPNRAGAYAVQIGAFKSEAEANKLRDRVRGGGFAGFVERIGAGAETMWRVRVGPYADRGGADNARAALKQKFQLDGMVKTQP